MAAVAGVSEAGGGGVGGWGVGGTDALLLGMPKTLEVETQCCCQGEAPLFV